ncbi:MAG: hypothetical protein K0U98_17700 [Deltaproteobacteria bacterium]|nr:hypothetical protein [Deltaproteobacteria bacterium]
MQVAGWVPGLSGVTAKAVTSKYDGAFQRVVKKVKQRAASVSKSSAALEKLLKQVLDLPKEERHEFVLRNPSVVDRRIVWKLLEESASRVLEDPWEGEEVARLALEVAQRIDPSRLPAFMIFDLQCRAWVEIGRAKLLQGDLRGSSLVLQGAELLVRGGTGDASTLAFLLHAKADLFELRGESDLAARARFEAGTRRGPGLTPTCDPSDEKEQVG